MACQKGNMARSKKGLTPCKRFYNCGFCYSKCLFPNKLVGVVIPNSLLAMLNPTVDARSSKHDACLNGSELQHGLACRKALHIVSAESTK